MPRIEGELWLTHDPASRMRGILESDDRRVGLSVEGASVGAWERPQVELWMEADGLHLLAEGEEVVFSSPDPSLRTIVPGAQASPLADRIRAAGSGSRLRRPVGKRTALAAAGVVGLLLVAAALSGGRDGSTVAAAPPATSETSTTLAAPVATVSAPAPTTSAPAPSSTASAAPIVGGEETGVVAEVVDGDTFRVVLAGGVEEPVRLIGIDAPERGQRLSVEAEDLLRRLVGGQEVRLVVDVSDRDRYGRLLRYVYVGDVFVNEEMVRAGMAVARRYPPDTAMAEVLEAAEAEAREAGIGGWAGPGVGAAATTVTTAATPATTATTMAAPPAAVPPNPGDSRNCSDFRTHAEAQAWFDTYFPHHGDVAGLDGDADGIACETLP